MLDEDGEEDMTDTERLDWLEKNSDGGGIFNDDAWGTPVRWAFSASGFSPVVGDEVLDGQWVFWVEKDDWKPTIREAIDIAIANALKYDTEEKKT